MPAIALTISDTAAARIAMAIGKHLGNVKADGTPRPATAAEVQRVAAGLLHDLVTHIERQSQTVADLEIT